jgi:sugar/nucleoside kinase (ribokinase family)
VSRWLDPPTGPPRAVGIGQITLDVHVRPDAPLTASAGGTCANVLAWLAWLGWSAHAVGLVGDENAGTFLIEDLTQAGVDCSALFRSSEVATPVVVQHTAPGVSSFSDRCPRCGAALPDVIAPAPCHVTGLPSRLPADVFFFDRDSPAALTLAHAYRAAGARIVYEPNYLGPEVPLAPCLALADLAKGSHATVPKLAEQARAAPIGWVIETLGSAGLRWATPGQDWQHLPALHLAPVIDPAGCGDATTAGILHASQRGASHPQALAFGQLLAAWNAAFPGARGGLAAVPRDEALDQLRRLATGQRFDPAPGHIPRFPPAPLFCRQCQTAP